jgi:hypothetical protein
MTADTKVPALHEEFEWPNVHGPSLNLEQKVALGRCGNESAFYDMVASMESHVNSCIFCSKKIRGDIIFNLPDNTWYIFKPPGDFNRHEDELSMKYVLALKRHTGDPSTFTVQEMFDLLQCFQFLKERFGCFSEDSGGMGYLRFGSTVWNAGTVGRHLHFNIDVPSGKESEDGLRVPIYKNRAGWAKDNKRYLKYCAVYRTGMSKDDYLAAYAAQK